MRYVALQTGLGAQIKQLGLAISPVFSSAINLHDIFVVKRKGLNYTILINSDRYAANVGFLPFSRKNQRFIRGLRLKVPADNF